MVGLIQLFVPCNPAAAFQVIYIFYVLTPQNYRKCDQCGHSPLAHYCFWNRFVANPIKNHGYAGKGRQAMLLLKNQIMPQILLRRTKVQCADDLALPPR